MKGFIFTFASAIAAGAVAFIASEARAVPVVRETQADFDGDLATIYPDHANPNLFYFLPNTGGFARDKDGKPLFGLVYWGLNEADASKGGGYITFVMEAGITDPLRNELLKFKAKHKNSRLSVVPFGKSSIVIGNSAVQSGKVSERMKEYVPDPAKKAPVTYPTVLGGLNTLFTDIVLPPSAGVAESQVGGNAILTQIGARAFRAGIDNPNLFTLSLCYEVYGALPTMDAWIHMDYKKIYQYFQASASGRWMWFGWSLSAVVEKLRQQKIIDWKIVGGDAKDEDYVKMIAKDLADTYLQPQLKNAPGPSNYVPFSVITFGFNAAYKEERATADYHMQKQQFITDDRCIALPMANLHKYRDEIVRSGD